MAAWINSGHLVKAASDFRSSGSPASPTDAGQDGKAGCGTQDRAIKDRFWIPALLGRDVRVGLFLAAGAEPVRRRRPICIAMAADHRL